MSNFMLFKYLRDKCDKTFLLSSSSEKAFYDIHSSLFKLYPALNRFFLSGTSFSLIQANIILKGLLNKQIIEQDAALYQLADLKEEEVYKAVHRRLSYMPYLNGQKIYVPFFSPLVNRAYDRDLDSLLKDPFSQLKDDFALSVVDPFDVYGQALYDSSFSSLIKVGQDGQEGLIAMYSIDVETVFVIDGQGRLEEEIRFFDDKEKIDSPKEDLFRRLKELMEAYFTFDKT